MMRLIHLKYLIIIFFIPLGKIFGQNITGSNYEIITDDENCRSGFYLSGYFDIVKPYSPTQKTYDVVFGIPDSSEIKVRIFSAVDNETIVNLELKIGRGCYLLNWITQNIGKLKSGTYFCSFEAHQKSEVISSDFNAIQKIIFIK